MKISPALSEVKKIAAAGDYTVLPVSCEFLSDFTTPIQVMKILKNVSTHCYMLESAQANEKWGRYTFLGYDPKTEITCIGGEMKIGNLKVKTDHPSDYLRQILADYKSPRFDYLPSFTGGLVGRGERKTSRRGNAAVQQRTVLPHGGKSKVSHP